jgi:aldehyde:ferredoxin oxidoreductase
VGDSSLESRIYSAVTGIDLTPDESYRTGEMLCTLKRALAVRDGRRRRDDMLHPLYFDKQDAAGLQYDQEELEQAKSKYYKLMGWDVLTGVPSAEASGRIGLPEVADDFAKRGIIRSLS